MDRRDTPASRTQRARSSLGRIDAEALCDADRDRVEAAIAALEAVSYLE
ncbi:hypothetical protein VB773_21745 [Haloarculaceae archaeon H-GB2-1]|nr:hypothetical protein [Haloarculaceae archaeon H-GB1-1]MEA5409933.1 hypothetical protein [Haloarculaceae archaeon H-GB2-1]